jgi:hypothetical protein
MGGPGSGPKAKAKSSVPLKALSINSLLFGGEKKVVDLRKRPREDDQAELTDQADAVAPQAAQEAAASVAPQAGEGQRGAGHWQLTKGCAGLLTSCVIV